jgi:hypothetical protein
MVNLETWNEAVLRYLSIIAAGGTGGASAFTDLSDVPNSYVGQALKFAQVNPGETGLQFKYLANPMQFIGAIAVAADFPTPAVVENGWMYRVTAAVTDNDPTKTNTGDSFVTGDEIVWNGTDWTLVGNASVGVAGGNYDIQYNSGGVLAANANLSIGNPANFPFANIRFVNIGTVPETCAAKFTGTAGWNGLQGIADFDSATDAYGIAGKYTGGGVQGNKYAGYFQANGGLNAYALYASVSGAGSVNYGIYAAASGATTNWAGYFLGDVNITGNITGSPTIEGQKRSGFSAWTSGGSYTTQTGATQWTLDRSGEGYIKGKKITWVGGQTYNCTAGENNVVYIDSTGTVGVTTTATDATYQDNIVLLNHWLDALAGNYSSTIFADNHNYSVDTGEDRARHAAQGQFVSGFELSRTATGTGGAAADREINSTLGTYVDGDISVQTVALTPATLYMCQTNGAGKWGLLNVAVELQMVWNNAGTFTVLTNGNYGVFALYVGKPNIGTTQARFYSVVNNAQYSTLDAAMAVVDAGSYVKMTNEILASTQAKQVGVIIALQNASGGYIYKLIDTRKTESTSNKGVAGGYASLSSSAVVPSIQQYVSVDCVQASATPTLSGTVDSPIDGVTLVAGVTRVAVIANGTSNANGIYVVQSGAWTRASDADTMAKLSGQVVSPTAGSVYKGVFLRNTNTPADVLGGTSVNYVSYVWAVNGGDTSMTISPNGKISTSFEATIGNIKMNGAVSLGTTSKAARSDHVHATDTSRAEAPTITNYNAFPQTLGANEKVIMCNQATAGTLNLPNAGLFTNKIYTIKNINTGVITVKGNGAQLIDTANTFLLNQWQSITVMSNGSTIWYII